MAERLQLILTCEHAGNRVPERYQQLFASRQARAALASHRGWDIGARELARTMAKLCRVHKQEGLHEVLCTRLLIETNRSLHHRRLFSEFAQPLDEADRNALIETVYLPHRQKVERLIGGVLARRNRALHVGVHTFTPIFDGEHRRADVALLYDPASALEKRIADAWLKLLAPSGLLLRRNYPYRGVSDGFTTSLRKRFGCSRYAGIELEVNQRFAPPAGDRRVWKSIMRLLGESLHRVVTQNSITQRQFAD